jgi:membrane-associated protease RseP (regulator of RpoE activity)
MSRAFYKRFITLTNKTLIIDLSSLLIASALGSSVFRFATGFTLWAVTIKAKSCHILTRTFEANALDAAT